MLFKADLLRVLGVANHPKAQKLWDLAWSHGHSSGLSEVAIYADDFADLIRS